MLIVAQKGRIVVDDSHGDSSEPIALMSITKSITALAIGCLIQDGALPSVDAPAHAYLPRWGVGNRADITLRHILEHTSGLESAAETQAVYASPDHVHYASLARLIAAPGERFVYDNRAVAVFAQVVALVAHKPLDLFVYERLYEPLGIATRSWGHDAVGNPMVMAGARLTGRELLAIGQLVLDGGRAGDRQLVASTWLAEATGRGSSANPLHGQLWWLVPAWTRHVIDEGTLAAWRAAGVDKDLIAKFEPLRDRELDPAPFDAAVADALGHDEASIARWVAQTRERDLPMHSTRSGPIIGCHASGYLGQHLVVLPARGVVAVRLIRPARHRQPEDSFHAFVQMVREL